MTRLLVCLSDRVSDWVAKGEVIARYLNPGDVFDEVHVLLTNDDAPDLAALATMAGRADFAVHNLPVGPMRRIASLGGHPSLLRSWAHQVARTARSIAPDVVRAYGPYVNAYAATVVRRELGTPTVLSLHAHPERDHRGRFPRTPIHAVYAASLRTIEQSALAAADVVLPVYSSIATYLEQQGCRHYEVVHNFVARPPERREQDGGDDVFRIVSVGRQRQGHKDPTPLIDAVAALPWARLLLIGDGPLHQSLVHRVTRSGAGDRIRLVASLPNQNVLGALAEADVFAYATHYSELSKGTIEAALAGLPLVIACSEDVAELEASPAEMVRPIMRGFREALVRLRDDPVLRRRLGEAAQRHAELHWSPEAMEARVAQIYRSLLVAS